MLSWGFNVAVARVNSVQLWLPAKYLHDLASQISSEDKGGLVSPHSCLKNYFAVGGFWGWGELPMLVQASLILFSGLCFLKT